MPRSGSKSGQSFSKLSRAAVIALCVLAVCPAIWSQISKPENVKQDEPVRPPSDTLGRGTPRGTVLGFVTAARNGNAEIAALYLNTPFRGEEAARVARELAVVLDRRLPARLNEISDKPEGSQPDPLRPDEDRVGTIKTENGDLNILVERVDRGKAGKVWLFSSKTLSSIPTVFAEVNTPAIDRFLPEFMVSTRLATIPLFEWIAVFVGMPLLYLVTGLLNRILSLGVGALGRYLHPKSTLKVGHVIPVPIRLLLIASFIQWLAPRVQLPLLARQFWSTTALLIAIVGVIWSLMLLGGQAEAYLVRRSRSLSGSAAVMRLVRRMFDAVILFGGFLFILRHFGIDLTAALAGLGVGGVAVALAAQKTLENVIAGISLIADQALRVGDFLNLGDVQGTVQQVGLRSTRIRTLDRTLVSLPNGQIANMKVETLSVRDRFWFHPVIYLRYETTPLQLRSVLAGIRDLLSEHTSVDSNTVRVRFIRFGVFSLDVDVFAYVLAFDWNAFLAIQEQLLFGIMEIIRKTGTRIAVPAQSVYLTRDDTRRTIQIETAKQDDTVEVENKHELSQVRFRAS